MGKKNRPDRHGFVYSTDPDFHYEQEAGAESTLSPAEQRLRIRLETKHRGGKTVTAIEGFVGKDSDLEDMAKKLKTYCGTGGSAKDGQVFIQGDQRDKVLQWLLANQYRSSKKI